MVPSSSSQPTSKGSKLRRSSLFRRRPASTSLATRALTTPATNAATALKTPPDPSATTWKPTLITATTPTWPIRLLAGPVASYPSRRATTHRTCPLSTSTGPLFTRTRGTCLTSLTVAPVLPVSLSEVISCVERSDELKMRAYLMSTILPCVVLLLLTPRFVSCSSLLSSLSLSHRRNSQHHH